MGAVKTSSTGGQYIIVGWKGSKDKVFTAAVLQSSPLVYRG
jgi:hypothetical protein